MPRNQSGFSHLRTLHSAPCHSHLQLSTPLYWFGGTLLLQDAFVLLYITILEHYSFLAANAVQSSSTLLSQVSEHLHLELEGLHIPKRTSVLQDWDHLCAVSNCHVGLQKEKQQHPILGWIPFKGRIQTCENNHSSDMWLIEIQPFSIRGGWNYKRWTCLFFISWILY